MPYEEAFQPPEQRSEPRPRRGDPSYPPIERDFESPRPTGVLVLAIFHLIIGGIGVLTNLCGLVNLASGNAAATSFQQPGQKQQLDQLQNNLRANAPFFDAFQVVFGVGIPVVLTACLIAGGIGLLQMRPWARKLSIGYALTSIVHKAVNGIYTIMFVMPITTAWMKTQVVQMPPGTSPQAQQAAQQMMVTIANVTQVVSVITPFLSMIYPIIVLLVLGRPGIVKAFQRAEYGAQAPL
jgi:hypothetical protein